MLHRLNRYNAELNLVVWAGLLAIAVLAFGR
jgi:hypothetical protein